MIVLLPAHGHSGDVRLKRYASSLHQLRFGSPFHVQTRYTQDCKAERQDRSNQYNIPACHNDWLRSPCRVSVAMSVYTANYSPKAARQKLGPLTVPEVDSEPIRAIAWYIKDRELHRAYALYYHHHQHHAIFANITLRNP
jgi:hypothetical protein